MSLDVTLVTDGSSDRVLMPILEWLFRTTTLETVELRWADLRGLPSPARELRARLRVAVDLYPCRLLLVHRDAERADADDRRAEVATANATGVPHVTVVPVRMQEAWLLHDEAALRFAAGCPSGQEPLDLPAASRWEDLADPKGVLHRALLTASGATGRRAKKFNARTAAHHLAHRIEDWSPLRQLSAFRRLEADLRAAMDRMGVPLYPDGRGEGPEPST